MHFNFAFNNLYLNFYFYLGNYQMYPSSATKSKKDKLNTTAMEKQLSAKNEAFYVKKRGLFRKAE